jgi:hypothetical protein
VYWRVIGTRSDGTSATSDIRSMVISGPQPVGNPILSPTSKEALPTVMWQNNCNTKFKVWFVSVSGVTFLKKKVLVYHISNPNILDTCR